MFAFGLALALSGVAAAGIVMQIRMAADAPASRRAVGSVLPVLPAAVIALLAPTPADLLPKAAVFLGMVLGMVAIGILSTGVLPSYAAYTHLLITYSLYWLAFATAAAAIPLWPAAGSALLILALAALLYNRLARRAAEIWSDILIFGLLVAAALWQSLVLVAATPSAWQPWPAFLGMLLIAIAHTGQALFRFQPAPMRGESRVRGENAPMLPLLMAAHLAIAWSVW